MPELTEILEAKPEKEVVKDGGSGTDSDEDENDSIPELEDTEAGAATSAEPAGSLRNGLLVNWILSFGRNGD